MSDRSEWFIIMKIFHRSTNISTTAVSTTCDRDTIQIGVINHTRIRAQLKQKFNELCALTVDS